MKYKPGTTIKLVLISLLFFLGMATYGQEIVLDQQVSMDEESQLLLAISNANYPVTPGDIYRLTFMTAEELITNEVLIESDYTLNLNIFGKFNARGKTFSQLKPVIEQAIAGAYPQGMPSLTITSVGRFQVIITGEIPQTRYVTAWGLSRLSEVISGSLGTYSSLRDIGVQSQSGALVKYDLFQAIMFGETENDPFIKPGDKVIIYRRGKEISIEGEVNRGGKFQIKENDTFQDIIATYAKGFSPQADRSRIKLERISDNDIITQYIDLNVTSDMALHEGDKLTVNPKSDNRPLIFIEGAVNPVIISEGEPVPPPPEGEIYNHTAVNFTNGETLYDLLQKIKPILLPYGDLENAYIIKDGMEEEVLINIEKLLYSYNSSLDVMLSPFDKLVIPVRQNNVAVMGAVAYPGTYKYIPGMNYQFYIEQASGLLNGEYDDNAITLRDKKGIRKGLNEIVKPEDKIIVTQAVVLVTGAVQNPGSYPYTYGKHFQYYINLAGGVDDERSYNNKVTIRDNRGDEQANNDIIEPGYSVFVHSDSFSYHFNRNIPLITASITLVTAIITMINLFQ